MENNILEAVDFIKASNNKRVTSQRVYGFNTGTNQIDCKNLQCFGDLMGQCTRT